MSSEVTHPVFTRTRPRSRSPMMRSAQLLRQSLSRPGQSTDPIGTTTAPASAALSQLLHMGTREACAEAARASVARHVARTAAVAAVGAETAQAAVGAERAQVGTSTSCCSRRGWPGELRRRVTAERDPRDEDFFDRLARAEARDQAAHVAIEAALTTSVDAPTSPSRRWSRLGSPVNISRQWSLHGRLSSPVDIRPSGAAVQDEVEQPRSTSPMMRAVQALQRRFTSSPEQRTVETGAGATASAAATTSQLYVGTREASAEAAPSLSMEAVHISREVAPIDSESAAMPEPTLTAAAQKTVPKLTAQSPVGSRLKQHRRASQAHRRRASSTAPSSRHTHSAEL